MERGQGPSRRGPLDPHRVGPFCLIGVRVNAEPMRLEKSKTPLASPAPYAAHAASSARLWAQAGGGREPLRSRRGAHRARPVDADRGGAEGARVVLPTGAVGYTTRLI